MFQELQNLKRSDTKMGAIEKQYGVSFDVRSDKKLSSYLKEKGYTSLSKALNRAERGTKKR